MRGMNVAFRVDATNQIGTGHVMRCLTLADALRQQGASCQFICRAHSGNLIDLIRQRGLKVHELPPDDNWVVDAEQTKASIGSERLDWLVVDHYALDARWEKALRPVCRRLMVIDDLADRPHMCDLLIDQNYEEESRYLKFVPAHCRLMLGPRYALLRPEYAEHRARKSLTTSSVKRLLVFFGGSDPLDLTGMTLRVLSKPKFRQIDVDVVVGSNYLHFDLLRQVAQSRGQTTLHQPRTHLADLMFNADMAIGAGGVTNWERICLGLPSLVVIMAENQLPISELLNSRGIIRLIGKSEDVTEQSIFDALLDEIESLKYMSRRSPAMAMCDGFGADRVVNLMNEIS